MNLRPEIYEPVIRAALAEDLGRAGDLTSDAVVPASATATGTIVARHPGRIAGLGIAAATFSMVDDRVKATRETADGRDAVAGEVLATLAGPARAILTAERTALNLLGRLSGIATATRDLVAAVAGTGARISDTRKTTPGLRALEKYAVRCGGGRNHRFGLDDAVLIKDNHLVVAGSVTEAVRRARAAVGHLVKVEVEVDTLEQLAEALEAGVDAVLLDNMEPSELREAVAMARGRAVLEASGGITLANAADVSATGVDVISAGWLTHSAPALDVGLDFRA